MDKFTEWWKNFVGKMNEQGIPLPTFRDPKTGKGSVTVTMVKVSFALCVVPVLVMIATVLTKLAGVFTLTDANQAQLLNSFSSAIQLYIASLGAYLGRKLQRDEKGKVEVESDSTKTSE